MFVLRKMENPFFIKLRNQKENLNTGEQKKLGHIETVIFFLTLDFEHNFANNKLAYSILLAGFSI